MRKRPPEPVNHERWLVSYADLLTLLFALFVVLYAMSQADAARFKQVAESMKRAFAGQPSLPSTKMGGTGSSPFPADNLGFPGDPMAERVAPAGTSPDQGLAVGAPAGASRNRQNLKDLNELQARIAESMSQELSTADLSDQMQTVVNHQGLVVRLAAADFFDDGQSAVRPELRPILDRIGRVLLKSDRQVRIEGHTDLAEEARLGKFSSGWELSGARAAWVLRYWVEHLGLDPRRLGAAGYSYYRPLSEKTDEWNRGKNRRIEVVILAEREDL